MKWLNKLSPQEDKLSKVFKSLSPGMINLLKDSLEVNPDHRKSASELLQNPIFDELH